jgi:hypothetical protein
MLADAIESYIQYRKLRFVLGIIGIFLVSFIMSCQEMRYMAFGKTVDATLELAQPEKETTRRGSIKRKLVVTYSFFDKDTFRRERVDVPENWEGVGAKTVPVQYIPGRPDVSRIKGQSNMVWVVIFATSVIALVVWAIVISRET